jgi:hypothetical protein
VAGTVATSGVASATRVVVATTSVLTIVASDKIVTEVAEAEGANVESVAPRLQAARKNKSIIVDAITVFMIVPY